MVSELILFFSVKKLSDFGHIHDIRKVLLVDKHQEKSTPELVSSSCPHELFTSLVHMLPVIAVHYKDQTLGVLGVVAPQRPDLVLAAHIPHGEADICVLSHLHIEINGGHNFTSLQFV